MIAKIRGFTIVEVLIVITVMGILVGIGTMSYTAYLTSSNDRARANVTKQWASTFNLYKARYTIWPVLPASGDPAKQVCLGIPTLPNGTTLPNCGQYTNSPGSGKSIAASGTDYNSLLTEVAKVGNIPTNTSPIITNIAAGPFVSVKATGTSPVTVTAKFVGFFQSTTCPSDFVNALPDSELSSITSGLPSNILVCRLDPNPQFSYTPSS